MDEMSPNEHGGAYNDSVKPKQKRPRKRHKTKSVKALKVSPDAIQIVWDYWVTTMGSTKAVLDDDRILDIASAIHDYGIDGCKKAVDGCFKSPWHMGSNPQHKKYNGISLIFRDAEKTEAFIQRADKTTDARHAFLNE